MKTSTKRLLALAALMTATLCALPASPNAARKAGDLALQTARQSVRLNLNAPTTIDVDTKAGKIIGMTAVMKDQSRKVLKAQSKPTCATGCPAGKTLHCWEDEEQMMSICVCGGGGTPGDGNFDGQIAAADFAPWRQVF